jgi:predicted metal-dependent hydrolase
MELDWNLGELAQGVAHYRRQKFFEAHEHWEIVWKQSRGEEKKLLQAMIQMAGAFHHWQRRNRTGAVSLLHGSLRRLESCGPGCGGMDVAALRLELRRWVEELEGGAEEVARPYPKIPAGHSQG